MCWYLCIENVFDWHLWAFFLFGLVKLISGYQNLKSTCPKGYQGFWNFASPEMDYLEKVEKEKMEYGSI